LMTQIDLLQELKVQLEFNRAGGQIGELLKRGERQYKQHTGHCY